ncbi:hypothetical protein [Halovenus halobia]|uniref:hypothetical protein n=1 Tax=Halovenus halobia TaxID=3396622 RepID=UPI003F55FFD9
MVDQTVPRQRGQTTQNQTQPTTDGGQPADHGSRQYVCLDCGAVSQTFRTECGDCGGEQFQTRTSATRTDRRLIDHFFGWAARLTAVLNPYIPR